MQLLNGRNSSSLNIIRTKADSGYYDDDGNYYNNVTTQTIPIKCSIQPFRNGNNQTILPDNIKASDVYLVYSKEEIKTTIEELNQEPDTTTIDGIEYECFEVEKWTRYGLSVDHYRAVFVKKDKLRAP